MKQVTDEKALKLVRLIILYNRQQGKPLLVIITVDHAL